MTVERLRFSVIVDMTVQYLGGIVIFTEVDGLYD